MGLSLKKVVKSAVNPVGQIANIGVKAVAKPVAKAVGLGQVYDKFSDKFSDLSDIVSNPFGNIEKINEKLKDLLLGKEQPATPPDPIAEDVRRTQLRALNLQERGVDDYEEEIKRSPEELAQEEIDTESQSLMGQREDMQRRLKELTAQRGIQGSSIGSGQELRINDDFEEGLGNLKSQIPQRIKELRAERSQRTAGLGSNIMGSQNAPIDFYGRQASREGGIAPLVGVGVGGYLGGAAGAQAGLGAGQVYQNYRG